MIGLDHDLAYEAHDCRPIVRRLLLRYAAAMAVLLLIISTVSLYAAWRQFAQSVEVYAVTQPGDVLELPVYEDLDAAQHAAAAMDDDRNDATARAAASAAIRAAKSGAQAAPGVATATLPDPRLPVPVRPAAAGTAQ